MLMYAFELFVFLSTENSLFYTRIKNLQQKGKKIVSNQI